MFCQKCGKEINDEAVICVGCGCPVKGTEYDTKNEVKVDKPERESSSTASTALIFAFLIPIVGLIMGIVGATKYKSPVYRHRCISAIVISVIVWIISFVVLILAMGI